MLYTAEAVSLGHPDKIADYISCYILDRLITQNPHVRFGLEIMIKDNTVILGGEATEKITNEKAYEYVRAAIAEIGYTSEYAKIWGTNAIEPDKLNVINLIGTQSSEIAYGVEQDGWGDQGVFVGYACHGMDNINRELYLARKLNNALYKMALKSSNLGLDIKTQITLNNEDIETVIVAIPMLKHVDLTDFIISALGTQPKNIIINGTGIYTSHASIADCGITGRKLACDFYSTACPIGGGSPWTKDATKADLTLNIYARKLALENLGDNDECFVYLSSCIGKSELPSCTVKIIKNGVCKMHTIDCDARPQKLIPEMGLNRPIFTELCRNGLFSKL